MAWAETLEPAQPAILFLGAAVVLLGLPLYYAAASRLAVLGLPSGLASPPPRWLEYAANVCYPLLGLLACFVWTCVAAGRSPDPPLLRHPPHPSLAASLSHFRPLLIWIWLSLRSCVPSRPQRRRSTIAAYNAYLDHLDPNDPDSPTTRTLATINSDDLHRHNDHHARDTTASPHVRGLDPLHGQFGALEALLPGPLQYSGVVQAAAAVDTPAKPAAAASAEPLGAPTPQQLDSHPPPMYPRLTGETHDSSPWRDE